MSISHIPRATLALLLVLVGLHLLAADRTMLFFGAAEIARGEGWRLVTGHLMHADLEHLFWNALGLGILGALIERRSAFLLWLSIVTGIVSVNILLLSPFSHLQYYCGLSGVLNTLLAVALWLEWRASRSVLVAAVAIGSVLKLIVEISLGVSVLTDISWPPYAWSHVAGLLGGLTVVYGLAASEVDRGKARREIQSAGIRLADR